MIINRIAALVLLVVLGVSTSAIADEVATATIAQSSAPATITRCIVNTYYSSFNSSFNLYNRASHALIDASIEYRFYDRDNTQIGRTSYTYTQGETLAPQDTGTYNNNVFSVSLQEPISAVSRITCRLTSAHYTGRLSWKAGAAWQGGPLSPKPKTESAKDDSPIPSAQAPATKPLATNSRSKQISVKFDVEKAWNDAARGGVFVHDSLTIHGGDNSLTVRPSDFVLTMALANGGQKTYPAMTSSAPTYLKYNALSKENVTAYQIDPANDLGRLGSLIVPAHTDVSVTVTFAVPDQIADATANRQVSLR